MHGSEFGRDMDMAYAKKMWFHYFTSPVITPINLQIYKLQMSMNIFYLRQVLDTHTLILVTWCWDE